MLLERRAHLGRLAIGMAGVERGDVGFGELGRLGELGLEPVDDRRPVAVEHPQRQAQRPHVLAAQRLLVAEAEGLHRVERQLRDVEVDDLPFGEAAVLQRVGLIAGLGEVARRELALVGDDQAAFAQMLDVDLERRRIHRDQHVGLVAGGLDRGRAEIDLEGARPRRSCPAARGSRRGNRGRSQGRCRRARSTE